MAEQRLESGAPAGQAWWSSAILIGAVIAAALLPIGALGARFGLWPFTLGLLVMGGGAVLAAIGVVTGVAGIVAAHRRRLARDRRAVYLGTLVSALVLAVVGLQFYTASSVPPIHDISTDVADPPTFDAVLAQRGEGSNPLTYDAGRLGPLQADAYPWVRTLETPLPPEAALQRAVAVLEDMGLEIVAVDPAAARAEATATTFWFGFKDDVVVRVRSGAEGGSRVDVRSVSRVGVSDLGTNARRIGEFLDRFRDRD